MPNKVLESYVAYRRGGGMKRIWKVFSSGLGIWKKWRKERLLKELAL